MDKKQEQELMKILKEKELIIPLYRTPHGELTVKHLKETGEYIFMLDSVILPKELQKDLSKLWKVN
jgi:hypothetical protein